MQELLFKNMCLSLRWHYLLCASLLRQRWLVRFLLDFVSCVEAKKTKREKLLVICSVL